MMHNLYKTGDADAPDQIRDRNGSVALDMCRDCGRGEIELSEPCDNRICRICDGGPGNGCGCNCGMEAWETTGRYRGVTPAGASDLSANGGQ